MRLVALYLDVYQR